MVPAGVKNMSDDITSAIIIGFVSVFGVALIVGLVYDAVKHIH